MKEAAHEVGFEFSQELRDAFIIPKEIGHVIVDHMCQPFLHTVAEEVCPLVDTAILPCLMQNQRDC